MIFSAKEVYTAAQALKILSGEKLPIKASYAVSRLYKKLESEADEIEKVRIELVKQHGEADDSGNYSIPQGNTVAVRAFIAEFDTFLTSTKIELDFTKLDLNQFGSVSIKPEILFALDSFVEFKDATPV